jgi:hypothetical protein
MPTPTSIYSLPFHTIAQMRAVAGLLRAYIDDHGPCDNDGYNYNPPEDLPEVAAASCHLAAAIEAHDKPSSVVCGGTLEYETMAGAFRVHRDGVYRFRCPRCGRESENDGAALTCDMPTTPRKMTRQEQEDSYRKHLDTERQRWSDARRIMGIPDPA